MATSGIALHASNLFDDDGPAPSEGALDAVAVMELLQCLEAGRDPFAALHPAQVAPALALTRGWSADRRLGMARLRAAVRLQAYAQSEWNAQATMLAGAAEHVELHETDGRSVAVIDAAIAEISLATRTPEADVRRNLAIARTIEGSLPETRTALAEGELNIEQAAVLAKAAQRLPEDMRMDLEATILPLAGSANANVLRGKANSAVHDLDPNGDESRNALARRRRGVWLRDEEDGNTLLCARMATMDAHACIRAIDMRAQSQGAFEDLAGRPQSITNGQRMAMALTSMVLGSSRHAETGIIADADGVIIEQDPSKPRSGGATRIDVAVTIDLPTLLGLRNEPVEVDGVAQADVGQLRDMLDKATDVRFRRLVLDPLSGGVLDVGQTVYRVPARIEQFVEARDGHCQWPGGCSVPADQCDLDHMVPFERGGPTSADNLLALCRWHHLLKTFHGYAPEREPDGSTRWRGPDGELLNGP